MPATIRDTAGEILLVSNEDLAEVRPEDVDAIASLCDEADVDLHLVLTVRDWAQQLPSDYQQFLKHRLADGYSDFLGDVRERRGGWADQFWRRQDPIDILDRWGRAVDPSRTHVIVVPSYSQDPDGVFNLMGEVVGFESRRSPGRRARSTRRSVSWSPRCSVGSTRRSVTGCRTTSATTPSGALAVRPRGPRP